MIRRQYISMTLAQAKADDRPFVLAHFPDVVGTDGEFFLDLLKRNMKYAPGGDGTRDIKELALLVDWAKSMTEAAFVSAREAGYIHELPRYEQADAEARDDGPQFIRDFGT